MGEIVWVVGQFRKEVDGGMVWDMQGVFDSEEKARAACRNWRYFYTSLVLNENAPDDVVLVDVHWPILPPEEVTNE